MHKIRAFRPARVLMRRPGQRSGIGSDGSPNARRRTGRPVRKTAVPSGGRFVAVEALAKPARGDRLISGTRSGPCPAETGPEHESEPPAVSGPRGLDDHGRRPDRKLQAMCRNGARVGLVEGEGMKPRIPIRFATGMLRPAMVRLSCRLPSGGPPVRAGSCRGSVRSRAETDVSAGQFD